VKPGEAVVSAALWGVGLGWLALCLPPLTVLQRRVPADRLEALTRVYTRGQVALTLCRFRAEVDAAVRPDRAYLFVQNHVNVLDHATVYAATPHFKQGLELAVHFDLPLYGPFMRTRGTLPVDRDDPRALLALRRRMREELDHGHSLLAFPEGTRTRDGRVGPFHDGLFHLARQLGVEVVPVALCGMSRVLRTGSRRFRPFQHVTVHVLAPEPTAGLTRADVPAFTARVRHRIATLVDADLAEHGP
jgi:1-acyl-sn-glycerol-3-phosphate acyltransferase